MTLLARRRSLGRRRRARRRRRCCTPTTRPCCAAAPCSRRSASTTARRSGSTRISIASRRRRSGSGCRQPDRGGFAARHRGCARRVRRARRVAAPALDRRAARSAGEPIGLVLVSTLAAGPRRAARARAPARGRPLVAGRARRREVDELRGEHGCARRRRARGADDALFVVARRRRARGADRRTSGGAKAAGCSRRRSSCRSSPASRAPRCSSSRRRPATRLEEGVVPARAAARRRRGLLSLVGARGDAGRRGRRRSGRRRRARTGRRGAPARAAGRRRLATLSAVMSDEKIRLGGMALPNGVLVHGPTSWACAIRHERRDDRGRVGAQALPASRVHESVPARPGPARRGARAAAAGEARSCPAAKLPMQSPRVARVDGRRRGRVRGDPRLARLRPAAQELLSGAALARAGGARAARLASSPRITAPSTSRSARTSTARGATKEHERCGGHLVGPLVVTSAVGNVLAGLAPERAPQARAGGGADRRARRVDGDLRLDDAPSRDIPSRRRCRSPATSSSTGSRPPSRSPEQLEVAEAALAACLELEHGADGT